MLSKHKINTTIQSKLILLCEHRKESNFRTDMVLEFDSFETLLTLDVCKVSYSWKMKKGKTLRTAVSFRIKSIYYYDKQGKQINDELLERKFISTYFKY